MARGPVFDDFPKLGVVLANAWLVIVLLGFFHVRILSSSTVQRLWERWVH